VIRNVILGRLRPAADPEAADRDRRQLEAALAGILALDLPGLISNAAGLDLALRPGGWSLAITNDWVDAEAYRVYDADPEHNVHRTAIVEVCEQVARVQFELPEEHR
jgi:hypothetical protein